MLRSDFDYSLPPELIAQAPLAVRSSSRLLHLDGPTGAIAHRQFSQVVDLLDVKDLLIVNDTRVLAARLFATKDSGGRTELLVERIVGTHRALVQVRASKALQPGRQLSLDADASRHAWEQKGAAALAVVVEARQGDLYQLLFAEPVLEVLANVGHVPLPPYIQRTDTAADRDRYQTLFAQHTGAVAAPTAGLHFDSAILAALDGKGIERCAVTLHVGAGTFAPIRVDDVREHQMHSEWYEVSGAVVDAVARCRVRGGRVVAVGTTVLRALESAASGASGELSGVRPCVGETQLFIYPGFQFQVVDAMLTNFHVPQSSLLMLVCAFAGTQQVLRAYRAAVQEKYRFFSYGDAMFVTRAKSLDSPSVEQPSEDERR